MKKNKLEIISNILFGFSILLFLIACAFLKESDAIVLLLFYIIILTCLFTAIMIQIKKLIDEKQNRAMSQKENDDDRTNNG